MGPRLRRSVLLLVLAALVATAAASAARQDSTLSVAAYSIPTTVFPKLESAYSATAAGNGVKFQNS